MSATVSQSVRRPLSLWERVRVRAYPPPKRTSGFAPTPKPASRRPGTTLIECTAATLMVGVLLVAALSSAGGSLRMTQGIDDRGRAQRLAGDLMNEILLQSYQEPDGSVGMGLDPGENTGNRAVFDDVD